MQLSDCEDADEHGLQSGVVERGGGEPQRAVGDAGALREKVEDVGALLDGLRAGEKTVTVEYVLRHTYIYIYLHTARM